MGLLFYRAGRLVTEYVRSQCLKRVVLHPERAKRAGGYLLACTHVGHLEPFIVSPMIPRQVFWMARIEFFKYRPVAKFLAWGGAFPVNRQGRSVSAIRTGIAIASRGDVLGIFPEGGRVRGRQLIVRGAKGKQGMATIAMHAQRPIVPVVVLGTERLTSLDPWLPARRGQVWIAFGNAVNPPAKVPRNRWRRTRQEFSRQVEAEFIRTYRELLEHAKLSDDMTW